MFSGYYRCHNCGRDVVEVRKTHHWRLCYECWTAIVPDFGGRRAAETQAERDRIEAYWAWYWDMKRKHPPLRSWHPRHNVPLNIAPFWPYCVDCGAETPEYEFSSELSLFGRHRAQRCPVCEAKCAVESVFAMAGKIMLDRDDEAVSYTHLTLPTKRIV